MTSTIDHKHLLSVESTFRKYW